jgi:hypothetical protein
MTTHQTNKKNLQIKLKKKKEIDKKNKSLNPTFCLT